MLEKVIFLDYYDYVRIQVKYGRED